MRYIPLNTEVKVTRARLENDEWGLPMASEEVSVVRARVEYNGQSRLTQTTNGKDIIFSASIFLEGAVVVHYDDWIEYYSPIHGYVTKQPQQITPMLDLAGKTIYTRLIV